MTPFDLDELFRTYWTAGDNLLQMLPALAIHGRKRQLRLFALACADLVRDRITDPRSVEAVTFAERHVGSGVAGRKGRPAVAAAAAAAVAENSLRWPLGPQGPLRLDEAVRLIAGQLAAALVEGNDLHAAVGASKAASHIRYLEWAAANGHWPPDWYLPVLEQAEKAEQKALAALLREIAHDPFRPATLAPAVRTPTVLALARGVEADRAYDRLPILADALEEAGCADADVLGHLRGPGPHARGCWALELVLGHG